MTQSNITAMHGEGSGHAVRAVVRGMVLVAVSAGIAVDAAGCAELEAGADETRDAERCDLRSERCDPVIPRAV